jgi:hypothetical protein
MVEFVESIEYRGKEPVGNSELGAAKGHFRRELKDA